MYPSQFSPVRVKAFQEERSVSSSQETQGVAIKIANVDCGSRHTAFVSRTGEVYTSGSGEVGQLGLGSKISREYYPKRVAITDAVMDVACGAFHTLFLTQRGHLYSTGGNSFGQLGHGHKKAVSTPARVRKLEGYFVQKIAAGHCSACITSSGELLVWGSGSFGEFLEPRYIA